MEDQGRPIDRAEAEASAEAPPAGVFGNLPDSRPGVRSPRRPRAGESPGARDAPRQSDPAPQARAGREPDALSAKRPAGAFPGAGDPRPDPEPEPSIQGPGDLAWAGIAIAAEAATLAVRLANRALENVRDGAER